MNGEEFSTADMLEHTWKSSLDLASTTDLPRLSQGQPRQFTLQVVQVSVWTTKPTATPLDGDGDAKLA